MNNRCIAYLTGCLRVLTKPQRKHLLVYLAGLLFLVKFRSTREINAKFGRCSTDSLQNFLNQAKKTIERINCWNRDTVAKSALTEHASRQGRAALIMAIDDTPSPRNGKKIEGLGIHHSASGLIKGLCAVTAIVKVGSVRFVWAIRGYRPKNSCVGVIFKSKVQIALEILKDARKAFAKAPMVVLMDSWYACAAILNQIKACRWTFVAAIKQNRIVNVNGEDTVVRHLAKGPRSYKNIRLSKKRTFRVARKTVWLPKIGWVQLLICKRGTDARFFITNDLRMTEGQMVRLYAQRFDIEFFHKEAKQYLGFGELFMRSWQGVQTHWTLVAVAYNLIVLANRNRSRSFRQMLYHFRRHVDHETMRLLPRELKLAA